MVLLVCRLNISKGKDGSWKYGKIELGHNHQPLSQVCVDYSNRLHDLTEDHRAFIKTCATCLLPPKDILVLLRAQCPDLPVYVTQQDVKNVAYIGTTAAAEDANAVLRELLELQRKDPTWYFDYLTDEDGRLTHLFWMTPRQREQAADLHQILVHDNTYKTNRFKLPFGVFCTVNRHGHTVLTASCLSFKEGTADYEWAYEQYQRAVGIAPTVVFTDADPGATAAVGSVWPKSFHGWCLWHIYVNIQKNLGSRLGSDMRNFLQQFRHVQRQLTRNLFDNAYQQLKQDFPAAAPYLDNALTPHVQNWAAWALQTFTAGGETTQRGEGLNRHLKRSLDAQSSLRKVLNVVLMRDAWDDMRCATSKAKDEAHPTHMVNFAKQTLPCIFDEVSQALTSHGLRLFLKQVRLPDHTHCMLCHVVWCTVLTVLLLPCAGHGSQ